MEFNKEEFLYDKDSPAKQIDPKPNAWCVDDDDNLEQNDLEGRPGGAMDLVASAENIIVAMQHVNKAGESKLLSKCTLPLTGINCVKKIVTELAVFDVLPRGGFKLIERAPGVSIEEIKRQPWASLLLKVKCRKWLIEQV